MTTHDQACFDQWLDNYATEEEKALPFEKQLEIHICWLSSGGIIDLEDMIITEQDRRTPQ